MTIGELIFNQRKKLNLTMEDVGNYCGVPRSTVCRWEKGDIQKIKRDKIESLCTILQLDPVIFFRPAEILTEEERKLINAFRNADETAKQYALEILLGHQTKKEKQLAI